MRSTSPGEENQPVSPVAMLRTKRGFATAALAVSAAVSATSTTSAPHRHMAPTLEWSAWRTRAAAGLVFIASGAVLVVELLGLRLLAPYVGLTLETTTAIIGAVLAGHRGGRRDRLAARRTG